MKLQEIKDVRVGQIYQTINNNFVVVTDEYRGGADVYSDTPDRFRKRTEVHTVESKNYKLVGKIGITHEIKGGKLVEIPRKSEWQVDDVIELNGERVVIVDFSNIDGKPIYMRDCNRINGTFGFPKMIRLGILGVTHQIVNDKEEQ
ncbi:MAG: hypothetical protein LBU87_03395 [Lactobacillales bacterium]|jgi:hypothetical protein|nr:hypothetical protein [Lactobacillales bacterium]